MIDDSQILHESIRKYWVLAFLTVTFSLLAAVFEGLGLGMLIPFLQSLQDDGDMFRTGVEWIDRNILGIGHSQLEQTFRICATILVATWLRSAFFYVSGCLGLESRIRIVEDLRMRIVDQLKDVALSFYSSTRSGAIISTMTAEMFRVSHLFEILVTVSGFGALVLIYVVVMTVISWQLTLLVVVAFSLLTVGLSRLIKTIRHLGNAITEANSSFASAITEFINGIRTVTAFQMQDYERARMFAVARGLSSAAIRTGRKSLLVQPFAQAIVATILILVLAIAIQYLVLPGKMDVAFLLTFLFALLRLVPMVYQLNSKRGEWAQNRSALTNVADMIRSNDKPYLVEGSRPTRALKDAVVFDDVTFAYDNDAPVIISANLRIDRGKMTALVGASGAGKSTLVDLIPRFHDPSEGRILWDGVDLRDFTIGSLREKIAVVSQDTFIFNETVQANIAYGVPDARLEDVVCVARQANAIEFIEHLPEGFDTILGERGVRLSGGQRQRIAIARALLRDPEILILDEATSALDTVSERLVQQSLERLMSGRTVVAIAHRLSTVENADWVIVLEDGIVVEQGLYRDLLLQRGKLWEYHSLQFQFGRSNGAPAEGGNEKRVVDAAETSLSAKHSGNGTIPSKPIV